MINFKDNVSLSVRRTISYLSGIFPKVFLQPRRDPHGRARVVVRYPITIHGRRILVPAANSRHLERFRRLVEGTKEPGTAPWIEQTLKDGDAFLDIGANVGIYSILAAIVAPGAKFFAFEPEPQSYAALAETVALNALPIKVFGLAVGERMHASEFNINGAIAAGYSDHQLGEPINWKGAEFEPALTVGVVALSIDELVQMKAIAPPTHIKIDVDGHEIDVLRGACQTLRSGTVKWVATEFTSKETAAEILEYMTSLGYRPENRFVSPQMYYFSAPSAGE